MYKEAKRVLIVDDDTLSRGLCALALRPAGHDLHEADCGEDAVSGFATARADLVILDVQMDGIDGYETCRRIRRLPGGDAVPIIMLTGADDADSIERAFEAGATDFIAKPFQWPLLAQRVRYALRTAAASGHATSGEPRNEETVQQEIEADLRRALAGGDELQMYLQPKVNIRTGEVCGAEALIRWQHPARGLMSPVEFIPVARQTGLIGPIAEWMLDQVCRQVANWKGSGFEPVPVSVNISATWLLHGDPVGHIDNLLRRYQLDSRSLILEVTESPLLRDVDRCAASMHALRRRGIAISLDDFGSGNLSLSLLKKLPVDELKLDRIFVTDIGRADRDLALAATIVDLARKLGLSLVAEGVETELQASVLAQMGCHIHQGFLYGKPMPAAGFPAYLMRSEPAAPARTA